MLTITFDELWALCFEAACPRCGGDLRRDSCVTCGGTGRSIDSMAVEASSLGFKPGEWPDRIIVDHNGRLYSYVRQTVVSEDGTRTYKSPGRTDLRVLND